VDGSGHQQQQQQQQQPAGGPDGDSAAAVIDWGAGIRAAWQISERAALQRMNEFLTSPTGLSAYEVARSYADGRSVSQLSPYLHFGQLSARLLWHRMKLAK
jgi:deoxyribodipyrimidine photolyase